MGVMTPTLVPTRALPPTVQKDAHALEGGWDCKKSK